MLNYLAILLILDQSLPRSEILSTAPSKAQYTGDAEESSNSISVNLLCWGVFFSTEYPDPFSDPSVMLGVCSRAVTELVFWRSGQVMDIF